MVIRRGEVWWASLPESIGSEPGSRRPLVSNSFNRSGISTVLGISLTTNIRLAEAPGNVLLTTQDTGLPKDSVANVSQVVTADKRFLTERVSVLAPRLLASIEEGLRLVLSL